MLNPAILSSQREEFNRFQALRKDNTPSKNHPSGLILNTKSAKDRLQLIIPEILNLIRDTTRTYNYPFCLNTFDSYNRLLATEGRDIPSHHCYVKYHNELSEPRSKVRYNAIWKDINYRHSVITEFEKCEKSGGTMAAQCAELSIILCYLLTHALIPVANNMKSNIAIYYITAGDHAFVGVKVLTQPPQTVYIDPWALNPNQQIFTDIKKESVLYDQNYWAVGNRDIMKVEFAVVTAKEKDGVLYEKEKGCYFKLHRNSDFTTKLYVKPNAVITDINEINKRLPPGGYFNLVKEFTKEETMHYFSEKGNEFTIKTPELPTKNLLEGEVFGFIKDGFTSTRYLYEKETGCYFKLHRNSDFTTKLYEWVSDS